MKIAIGADHGGYVLKKQVVMWLKKRGHEVKDFGTFDGARCDYPKIGHKAAAAVAKGSFERGILICKSGLGMSIVANKVKGIRAALIHNTASARSSREHNDSNVAVLAGSSTKLRSAQRILSVWLKTPFTAGRHARRIKQISKIEKAVAGRRRKRSGGMRDV